MSDGDLDKALQFAQALARKAGEIARRHYDPTIAFDPKGDNSPVTQADIEINKLVIQQCGQHYPDAGVLGEEESAKGTSALLWVCDPIDGTMPYMLGAHASTFCIALVDDGVPVVGVVYEFLGDRMYSAVKGRGAQLNNVSMPVANNRPLKWCNFELFLNTPYQLQGLRGALSEKNWNMVTYASSAFMSMAVATGRIAGVVSAGNKAWDYAAVKVIVEACGGKVTALDGTDQRYDSNIKGAIVTGRYFGDELRDTVVNHYIRE